jgi:phenylalanyl-tRNA synthetase beta chain
MKISLNEIKKYVDIKISADELVKLIGSRLVEVEGTEDLSPKYKNIYIVKVIDCKDIEGTHLHLCQIDAGKEDLVQVVCGAPNVHKGMLAAWIAPGAIVPATYGGENFEIGVRKLRGYESNGMLAAADELALGTDHEGIIEFDPKLA